ncbi:extracellular matrix protein precursor [Metarhizium rileyi]|uniref:Extracellular matrix protein n=1 Tax=Metarhizium rileyi (strain RCEF 4871) TaxID=1649241 RepID=A0A162M164_METRR|nr:extracellular matrix protein precursor [Metarhizium rileyi RCEF 4871]
MKYALAISALSAAAAAQPAFRNTQAELAITEGKPFTLKFDGCSSSCTITLQTGPAGNAKDVLQGPITTTATGTSFVWTPEGFPTGEYFFKITDNAGDAANPSDTNYSGRFQYVGTGAAVTSDASTATAVASTVSEPSMTVTSSASMTLSTSSGATNNTRVSSPMSHSNSTISRSSMRSTSSATNTAATTAATTSVPNAGVRATPFAFMAGAIAALAYLV